MNTTKRKNPLAAGAMQPQPHGDCQRVLLSIRDALEVLNGKWKIPIVVSLSHGTKRFKQIAADVHGITDKMLSKELKDLEAHQLITRTVYDSFPPTVEYAITEHGRSLGEVIDGLKEWGDKHRKKVIRK